MATRFLSLSAALAATATPAAPTPPNIIVIVSDDHGWADLACQGPRRDVRTPHLDALAAEGVRFAAGYVSAPVWVPSRAGLLTGRYQTRFGIESNDDGPLPATELILGDRLRAAGYNTGLAGKWHVAGSRAITAARWKHLHREGIPYFALFGNAFNHPNAYGHGLFIEEIMTCFQDR